jgi:large subunit ribosomal protein L3
MKKNWDCPQFFLVNMKFILGQKLGMSRIFREDGKAEAVTLIKAGPAAVVQIKNSETDGYDAVQMGFGERKAKNVKKSQKVHFKNLGNFRFVREFRYPEKSDSLPAVGDKIDVSWFQAGELVKISGLSKGKGFQGTVKRHGFRGGPATHGQKHRLRAPGSIGATTPQHVLKGKRMAGRMGGERVTVKNLKIMEVDAENNVLAVKGAIPGRRGTLLEIRSL